MSIARDDRYVTDAQGRALAGAQVFWCTQPATVPGSPPPGPLATIYATIAGGTPESQPVLTDGFGHAFAYMDNSVLYTVVIYHPLFGVSPVVLGDQAIAGANSGVLSALTITPAPNGTNRIFALSRVPENPANDLFFVAGSQVGYGAAYTVSGNIITWIGAVPPQDGDSLAYFTS